MDGLWVILELSGAMPLIALAGVSLCWEEELRGFESLMGINGGIGWVGVEVVCLDRFKTAVSTWLKKILAPCLVSTATSPVAG